ncbi:MAG: VWA domain-containing protein [Gammaproteobacteria bacterium]|nr:VWA domain-containing protein [Gammaproteobacteria bacterium]
MEEFHFLRPWWWLALPVVVFLAWRLWRFSAQGREWQGVVDDALAPYVLESGAGARSRWPIVLFALITLLALVALSGPVWEKREAPVFQAEHKMVVVLDLSRSMDARDVKPSRLIRAKYKLGDIFRLVPDVQAGLVVFSEVPYTISPVTDDVDTVAALLPALSTDVMPVQGSRISLALDKAGELLERAAVHSGQVILISDSAVGADALASAKRLREHGFPVSVLAIGTEQGSPVQLADGGLLKDSGDEIVIARLDRSGLRDLARVGGGRYSDLASDDSDIRRLVGQETPSRTRTAGDEQKRLSTVWLERSPWLIPLIALLAVGLFRRGVL